MDSPLKVISLAVFLLFNVSLAFELFQCEDLSIESCPSSISSSGNRCVLEKYISKDGELYQKCQTTKIMAGTQTTGWIESVECIKACGLQKMTVGLSTDALVDRDATKSLCSHACQRNCFNIVDLYTKLSAGEGTDLQSLCQKWTLKHRRKLMAESVPVQTLGRNQNLGVAMNDQTAPSPEFHHITSLAEGEWWSSAPSSSFIVLSNRTVEED